MFVRTKDRILEVTKDTKGTKFIVFGKTLLDYKTFIKSEDDIINQSDIMDELCDGYYLYNGYDDKFNLDRIYTTDEKTKALDDCKDLAFHIDLMCRGRYICELRAFIETDKGLIFIGKFNENEKLVLI